MGGMGGGGAGAIGSIANDTMGMAMDFAQMAKVAKDQGDIDKAYDLLFRYADMDPEKAKAAAQQMGLQPQVVASKTRNSQLDALRQLQDIGAKGGMDNAAIAANQQAQMGAARQNKGNLAAIQSQNQMRGMNPGSGAAQAGAQAAAQAGYNTTAMAGTQNAADAQMRALQAINSSGRLAGDIASADEQRAQFNNEQASARDRYNTGVRNSMNQFNADAEFKTWQANEQKRKDTLNGATGKAGAQGKLRDEQTGYERDAGNRTQNIMSNVGGMAGG